MAEALQASDGPAAKPLNDMFSDDQERAWAKHDSLFGIGLSGGGIRSATFNLGVLQVLAGKGVLDTAHYLSTVSGGGYLGGCVHALNAAFAQGQSTESATALLKQIHYQRESVAVRHLRAYSHFLAPNGFLDQLRMFLQPFAGFVVNLLVLLTFVMSLAGAGGYLAVIWRDVMPGLGRLTGLSLHWLLGNEGSARLGDSIAHWPGTYLAAALVVVLGGLLLWLQNKKLPVRNAWARALSLGALAGLGLVFLDVQVGLAQWVRADAWGRLLYWAAVPLLAAVLIWRFRGKRFASLRGKVLLIAAGAMAPLALLWTYLALLHGVMTAAQVPEFLLGWIGWGNHTFGLFAAAGLLLVAIGLFWACGYGRSGWLRRLPVLPCPRLWLPLTCLLAIPMALWTLNAVTGWAGPAAVLSLVLLLFSVIASILGFLVNINMTAPHSFYRDRLSEAYVFQPTGDATSPDTRTWDDLKLSELTPPHARCPYPLINATMNVSRNGKDKHKEMAVRSPDFFLFSPLYVGSDLTGYCPTAEMERRDPHLNLPTAMAISGAAASSNMGDIGLGEIRMLMTVLNVRLGYWLPNPGLPKTRPSMDALHNLQLEMWGAMSKDSDFVNVSDGGHIENLGAYELIRRQCRFIILGEAEDDSDPNAKGLATMAALARLMRMVRIDLGYFIDFAPADLQALEGHDPKRCWAVGTIYYPDNRTGRILYLKAALTGGEDHVIKDYARANPAFPQESTADQFFSEQQFEAYRSLGYHVAKTALGAVS
nr:hypothetical protein [Magnetospirillum sulfuroxidans]